MPYPVEFFESVKDNIPRFRNETGSITDSNLATNDDGDLIVPGHIFVGSSGVSIRYEYFSGNTGVNEGDEVSIPHTIEDISHIYGISASVFYSVNGMIPPEYTRYNGYQYSIRVSSGAFHIENSSINSFNILDKPFLAYILYSKPTT